jgi:hypothetical protein
MGFLIFNLPHGDPMLDNIITVTTIELESEILTHNDSLELEAIANMRVKDGGTAVVTARNRLNRYVEEIEIPETPNKALKKSITNNFWVTISPNPSAGEMIIKTNAERLLSLHIYDSIGNLVYKNVKVENQTIINFNSFTNGLYSVNLYDTKNNVKTFKWVLNK